MGGITKGFGGTMLELEDRKHQERMAKLKMQWDRNNAAIASGLLEEDSVEQIINETPDMLEGASKKEKDAFHQIMGPIMAIGKLMTAVPRKGQTPAAAAPAVAGQADQGIITSAPRRLKVKPPEKRLKETLDLEAAKLQAKWKLEDERLSTLSDRQQIEIDASVRSAMKFGKDKSGQPYTSETFPEQFRNNIIASVLGANPPDIPEVTMQQRTVKEGGESFIEYFITDPANVIGRVKSDEAPIVWRAYAEKLKKPFAQLTDMDKVKAEAWKESLTPERQTDMKILIGLYKTNRPLFNALKGIEEDPKKATVAQKISMIGQANLAARSIATRYGKKEEQKAAYEEVRNRYLDQYPDFPGFEGSRSIMKSSSLPRPTQAGEIANEKIQDAYLDFFGGDVGLALQAMKEAGWK